MDAHRLARRLRTGLRGWGGVGAMAAVCALALAFALLLPHTQSSGAPDSSGGRLAHGTQARADTKCDNGIPPQDQSLSPSGGGATPVVDKIKAREDRRLIVGVDTNSYRWGYLNPNNTSGSLEGFDIDLVHRIAKDLLGDPNAVSFKAIPTNQRIPAIQSGQVDMVVRTMTITCDRLGDVAFSAPYFRTGQQVLAPKKSTITGYNGTLAGKKVCSAEGSTALDNLKADKGGRIPASTDIRTVVPNQLDCLVKLQLGEVDAVVTDGALAASQAAQDPTVELKGGLFTDEYYGVAMKRGSDDLVRQVNRTLENYVKDGGWADSYQKWLHPTMDQGDKKSTSATPPAAHYK
ncbi:glutamate ABC transporter substrate-binding protein [Streptomyces spinosirectus]|jgi:polar amino acid transport system substrate-binding protein|uniref:glutamate ABC transporter substrate-binding protein n=1 Tax=Streptomyces TaxID=1883 RepID=UPI000FFEFD11|nr:MULTISPECIES: glutamate ABC transporter substrate-binding protein [Streptomyces]MBY8344999.1 glutamate ABC transporter substrate-binding protein [Streptomyces plumbidurans]UIR18245.1 glutamate ABC transporter substrate-binding protein [Streptomyces spinosirectus]